MAWISPLNFWPFCSSATRFEVGVDALKNVSQLDLIVATVADEPPPLLALADGLFPADVADVAGAVVGEVVGLDPFEHAVIAAASARPSAGARKIRRSM
jgi:hypothetical protein